MAAIGATTDEQMSTAAYNPKTIHHLNVDRLLGIMGGVTVLVATGLPWYTRHLSVRVPGFADRYATGFTLWDVRTTASWLVVAAVAIGVAALLLPILRERTSGLVACVAGLGVIVYGLVALFVVPDLGSLAVGGPQAVVSVDTSVSVGPFVAIAGGFLMVFGGAAAASDAITAASGRSGIADVPDA
jgi:hypothetical protein